MSAGLDWPSGFPAESTYTLDHPFGLYLSARDYPTLSREMMLDLAQGFAVEKYLVAGWKEEDNVLKMSGLLLVATGVLDVLYVVLAHRRQLAEIVQAGVVNAVELTPSHYAREVMFWHLTCGLTFVLLGVLVHWSYKQTGTVPLFLGGALFALGIYGAVLVPASGFWLFLPQALLIFIGRYQTRAHTQVA